MSWLRLVPKSASPSELLSPAEAVLAQARAADFTRDSACALAEQIERAQLDVFALVERALDEGHDGNTVPMLLFAAIKAGREIPATLLGRAIPVLGRVRLIGVFVGRASGDRLGMLLDLVEAGQLSYDWQAFCLLVAIKLLDGQPPPPRLLAQIRLLGREEMSVQAAAIVGQITLEIADGDVYSVCGPWVAFAIEHHMGLLSAQVDSEMAASFDQLLAERGPRPMQRADARVGRNDPCPCGSGKKAKRCCPDAVRTVLVTAPPSRRRAQKPLDALEPCELAGMDLGALPTAQLLEAFRTLARHRFWLAAERALEHLALRADLPEDAPIDNCRRELILSALRAAAPDVIRRQAARLECPGTLPFFLDHLDASALGPLEQLAGIVLRHQDPQVPHEFALTLLDLHPALGILVARGALDPNLPGGSEMLLHEIERARDRLHLPPWDIARDFYNGLFEPEPGPAPGSEPEEPSAAPHPTARGESTPSAAAAPVAPAAPVQPELKRVNDTPTPSIDASPLSDLERKRLRAKISELKALIQEGQAERTRLRAELAAVTRTAQVTAQTPRDEDEADTRTDQADDLDAAAPTRMQTLVPIFAPAAQDSLRAAPAHVARIALRVAAGLAAADPGAWSSVKRVRAAEGLFSARVGIHHRLLFRLEPARGTFDVVAFIHRRELDAALRHIA